MKTTIITAAFVLAASTLSAAELGMTGIGIGATADVNYTTGADVFAMDLTPAATFNKWNVDFTAETTIDILSLNDGDIFKGIDLSTGYNLWNTGLRAYTEISVDADWEMGDLKTGLSFAF